MKVPDHTDRFGEILRDMTKNRWCITIANLGLFALIVLGIIIAMMMQTQVASEWKEILLLLIGAFLGNYNKVTDFWFSNFERDKMLVQKMDEEDGLSVSTVQLQEPTVTPSATTSKRDK